MSDNIIITTVEEFCRQKQISITSIGSKELSKALRDIDITQSKKSYLKTICQHGTDKDFERIRSGEMSIHKVYRLIKEQSKISTESAIEVITREMISSCNKLSFNIDTIYWGLKFISSFYKKQLITKDDFQSILNRLMKVGQSYDIRRSWLSDQQAFKYLNVCVTEHNNKLHGIVLE